MTDFARCNACSRTIFWAVTPAGAKMPIDPIPKSFEPPYPKPPNIVLENGVARTLKREELEAVAPGTKLYLAHWATCPHARRYRDFEERRRRGASSAAPSDAAQHHCHARGCTKPVPPRLLMCGRHWMMVPPALKRAVWDHYRKGQEVDKQPSAMYLVAADAAITAVAKREQEVRA